MHDWTTKRENRLTRWVFDAVRLFVIRKVETPNSGLVLIALGDPINAAIVDELLAVYSATPGALAVLVHRNLGISRPVVSTHLTQLRQLRVVRLLRDGTMTLRDPGPIALLLQISRDFAKDAHIEGAKDESASHYRTQRRINKGLQHLETPEPVPVESLAITISSSPAPLRYAGIASEDPARATAASTETTSSRASTSADGSPAGCPPMTEDEIDEIRRIRRASFPFDTPWPTKEQRRAAARETSRTSR